MRPLILNWFFKFSKKTLFFTLSLFPAFGFSLTSQSTLSDNGPWFTGPLLSPSATSVPAGHFNIEPYIYSMIDHGSYDHKGNVLPSEKFYETRTLLPVKIGLPSVFDCGFNIETFFKHTEGVSDIVFGDFACSFGMQVLKEKNNSYQPNLKFSINEIFPTGNYQHLKADKKRCDIGGNGSFGTRAAINASKLISFFGHFLNLRTQLSTTVYTPVKVSGINTYGGTPSTKGTVYRGSNLNFLSGLELSLTKNIAFACDFAALFNKKTAFRGSSVTPIKRPSSYQISLAPALEYNWNKTHGVIAGSWFTLAGRNARKFNSVVVAYNYYH